jgi:hypothetical protein
MASHRVGCAGAAAVGSEVMALSTGFRVVLILMLVCLSLLISQAGWAAQDRIGPQGTDGLTFRLKAISGRRLDPFQPPAADTLTDQIALFMTPGEYEPVSFGVFAQKDLQDVLPVAGDLTSGNQVIPAANIDIKLVKRWYQAGTAWLGRDQDKSRRVLVPELLLNDPALVKVDYENKENYLALHFDTGIEYVWISDPTDCSGRMRLLPHEWPVRDSAALLPVDIASGSNEQYWVTVHIPETALPGAYTGYITFYDHEGRAGQLQLQVTVLPFTLAPPVHESSIYYRGVLDTFGIGSISAERKTEQQYRAELADMVAHGVTNPIVYQPLESLASVLKIRAEFGLNQQPLYYLGVRTYDPEFRIAAALALAKQYGIPEVYFYAIDEAAGAELAKQRPDFERVHAAGGKVFAASWQPGSFELVGDIQDLYINHGRLSLTEARKWHNAGKRIWSYGNPQTPAENPELYRRNYGLLLWINEHDGAAPYAYQDGFGNIWNDFDHLDYRDHNFTYPTVDGVISTIAWEGYREAVDDLRYLNTLLQAITVAKAGTDVELMATAEEAEAYLAGLTAQGDLDEIRGLLSYYILKLQKSAIPAGLPTPLRQTETLECITLDPALEQVVRTLLKKESGPITPADAARIISIEARDKGVKTLEGLQYFTSLRVLRLDANGISDLSPLAHCQELRELFLTDNPGVEDITPIAGLENLFRLTIHRTSIADFMALAGHPALQNIEYHNALIEDIASLPDLPNLRELHAGWSRLADITGIGRFPRLTRVFLAGSRVTDITPLLDLPVLQTVWLDAEQRRRNPAVVERLRAKGVFIDESY